VIPVRYLLTGVLVALLAGIPGEAQVPAPPGTPLAVRVTGTPVLPDTLRLAIATAARLASVAPPFARIEVHGTRPPLAPLAAPADATLEATLAISLPGAPPARRVVPVAVTPVVLPWSDAQALFVSNSPETLPFGKVLYAGSLARAQTVRLLYHHQNGSQSRRMTIRVDLSNPTRSPVTLWVTAGSGGPSPGELAAGHEAAKSFLEQYWDRSGFVLTLPPTTTVPLLVHDLPPRDIASGVVQASLLEGAHLNVEVVARAEGEPEPPPLSFAPDADLEHQRGAFPRPQVTRSLSYTVGGPGAEMVLGADADLLPEARSRTPLQGNYGVTYWFAVEIANPTLLPAAVALVMHADGGPARGTFLVDGQVVDGPPVLPRAPRILTTVHVPPLARQLVRIGTMPESGSNYPVRLTLEPAW
jgi:hypothetical protein